MTLCYATLRDRRGLRRVKYFFFIYILNDIFCEKEIICERTPFDKSKNLKDQTVSNLEAHFFCVGCLRFHGTTCLKLS